VGQGYWAGVLPVNRHQHCQISVRWLRTMGGNFGREILHLSVAGLDTRCFGAPGGAGAGAKSLENGFQKSVFPN
jgi:hypothetical protein